MGAIAGCVDCETQPVAIIAIATFKISGELRQSLLSKPSMSVLFADENHSLTIERPCLYLVATPIGNLADIGNRALAVLKQVDIVLAEDTRRSVRLLEHYAIKRPLESFHDWNESARVEALITRLTIGSLAVALISDAGTPLISDPGFRLVRAAHEANILIRAIPGPSAILAALTSAGLPTDRFLFEGFLPNRKGARRAHLATLRDEVRTMIFFEAPHRVHETLGDLLAEFGPEREICVARELTKHYETLYRGSLTDVNARVVADPNGNRGEFVIVLGGSATPIAEASTLKLLRILLKRMSQRDAIETATEISGLGRNELYALALTLRHTEGD